MFSFAGDTVLDPFLGTGTTTEAAIRAERSSIGYEIEPRYLDIIRDRFAQVSLTSDVTIHLPTQPRRR
jgi:site-specific DNA-methyltransferase (adenine-specific)